MSNLMAINGNIIGGLPIASENLRLLWENPNPTAEFTAQTVTLARDDYDCLLFEYDYTASGLRFTSILSKGQTGIINVAIQASDTVFGDPMRRITYSTATSISISDCSYQGIQNGGTISTTTNNSTLIPIAVYGIYKKSIANTEASKCMLSDGVTSVEDIIGRGSVSISISSSQTWATILSNIKAVMDPSKLRYSSCMVYSTTVCPICNTNGYGTFTNTTGYTDSDNYTLTFDFNVPYVVLYGISAGKSVLTNSACQVNGTLTIYY